MNILVIDIGGTNVKFMATGEPERRRFESGPTLTPEEMVKRVVEMTKDWKYEAVSIGYPGPVIGGKPRNDPWNLGAGWVGFDFEAAFGMPIKLVNDAAMQALGSYDGGKMLFLGLGTGLGTALVFNGKLEPLEMAHLPYKKGRTFEEYLGVRGLERRGVKKWRESVADAVEKLKAAMEVDYVVLGGGNAKKLKEIPSNSRMGDNKNAFTGGFRLWEEPQTLAAPATQ